MFRHLRSWPAVLTVAIVLLSTGAFAQGADQSNPFAQAGPAQKGTAPPAEGVKHYNNGVQFMKQRKLDPAIREFQAAKKLMPNQPAVLMNLGSCYMQKQNLAAAEGAFREAVKVDPKHASPALAQVLMMEGKDAQALPLMKKLAAENPKDAAAQLTLGGVYMKMNNLPAAIAAFKAALAIKPNDKDALSRLAVALMNAKRFPEARQVLDKRLKVADDPETHGLYGYVCEQAGDKTTAIAQYNKIAWKGGPQSHAAIMSIVRIYGTMNKPDECIKILKKALTVEKGDYDININLGRILSAKRNYKEAEPYLLAARRARSDAAVNVFLAMNCLSVNDPKKAKEAETYVQTALKLDPKDRQAIDVYAYVLDSKRKTDDAIAQYRKWERYYPADVTPNVKIAGMLLNGKNDLAYTEYQKAMKKSPKDATIMVSAAACLKNSRKFNAAVALLQKAIAMNPKNETAIGALAEVYTAEDKGNLAIEQYNKILEFNTKSTSAIRQLAAAYDAKKDYNSEIEMYRKLCQIDKQDIQSAIMIARIYDKADQLDSAIAEIKKVVDANQKSPDPRSLYGDLLVKKKDLAGALVQYGELIKSEQYAKLSQSEQTMIKSWGYYQTGTVQESLGKPEDAITSYKKCLEGAPSDTRTLDALGKIYETKQQQEDYYTYMKSLLEPGKDDLPYGYYWAAMHKAKKDDDGVKTLEQLGQKFADSVPIHHALAKAYIDTKANPKAIDQYKGLLAKNKADVGTKMALCDLYKTMDRNDDAVSLIKEVMKQVPSATRLWIDLGDLYMKMGKKSEALDSYNAALKKLPNNGEIMGKIAFLKNPPAPPTVPAPSGPLQFAPGPAPAPGAPTPTPAPAAPSAPATAPTPGATPAPTPAAH